MIIRLITASAPPGDRLRLQKGIDMSRRRRAIQLPDETSDALHARLRRFVRATRDDVTGAVPIPFPAHVTVPAGPLRRIRGARTPHRAGAGGAGRVRRAQGRRRPTGSAPDGFLLDDTGRADGKLTK